MAGTIVTGKVIDIKSAFLVTTYVGSETLDTIVGADEIALVFNSSVSLRTLNVDVMVERLRDTLMEQIGKST